MSKRRFTDDNEDDDVWTNVNPDSKRIRFEDGTASSVNPLRYDPKWDEQQAANAKSLMSDDDEDDDDQDGSNTKRDSGMEMDDENGGRGAMEALAESSSFDNLLYQLASMNVGGNGTGGGGGGGASNSGLGGGNEREQIETCPICVARMPLSQFANHVYRCLDGMAPDERMDLKTQCERDEAMAFSMVQGQPHRYSQDMSYQCPVCGKMLSLGMSINVHANECLDAQEADEASTAMGKFSIESASQPNQMGMGMDDDDDGDNSMMNASSSSMNRPKGMTRDQMSACANALLSNRKGTAEYDAMLSMFETLGFNEKNIRRVVEEGKKEKKEEMARMNANDDRKGREEEESGMTMMVEGSSLNFKSPMDRSASSSFSFPNAPPPTPMIGFAPNMSGFGQHDGVGASGFGPGMFSNPSTFGGMTNSNGDGNDVSGFGEGGMEDISDSEL